MMGNWDDLRLFLAVAREQSLSGAGKLLRLDPATLGRCMARLAKDVASGQSPGQKAHCSGFDIAFDARDLPGKADMGARAPAQLVVQQGRRIEERVAVDAAEPRE